MIIDTILKIILALIGLAVFFAIFAIVLYVLLDGTYTADAIDERIANRIRRNRRN